MSANRITRCLTAAASVLAISLSPAAVPAAEWYWVNDFGGTWDEEIGDVTSWRDPADDPGIPSTLDDALLVLPYSMSFCNPDDTCFTQPVQINYRNDIDVTLGSLIIESDNLLFQGPLGPTTASQLDLASLTEIIGGSSRPFTPPPSFFIPPDSPGIYPVGQHIQTAGTNFVRDELLIGVRQGPGTEGIRPTEGTYELSGTASLTVGRFGVGIEKIGAGGDGLFVQSGGSHTIDGTLIIAEQTDSTGSYRLSDGNLAVETIEIIGSSGIAKFEHTDGTHTAQRLLLGQHPSGDGTYSVNGDGTLEVSGTTTVGGAGYGMFVHDAGTHTAGNLVIGEEPSPFTIIKGRYRLGESSASAALDILNTTTVGQGGMGTFYHSQGSHVANSLVLGQLALSTGAYTFDDGVLYVRNEVIVGGDGLGSMLHKGGEHLIGTAAGRVGRLSVGTADGAGIYSMSGGVLRTDELHVGGGGVFHQENTATEVTIGDWLRIGGPSSDTLAVYRLFAGTLEVSGELAIALDSDSEGQYEQTGGTATSNRATIGGLGAGQFRLTAGTHEVRSTLVVGVSVSGDGTNVSGLGGAVEMTGGSLIVGGSETLFNTRNAGDKEEFADAFRQTGGSHTIGGTFTLRTIGEDAVSRFVLGAADSPAPPTLRTHTTQIESVGASIEQITGQHVTGSLRVNGGRYLQRAGEVVTDDLLIGPGGVYDLHGGTLTSGGVRNDGEFTQDGGSYVASGDMINNGTYLLHPGQRLEVANLFNNGNFEIMGAFGRRAELLASGGSINIVHGATLGVAWGTVSIAGNIEANGRINFAGEGETLISGDVRIGEDGIFSLSGGLHGAAGQTVYVGGDVHLEQSSASSPRGGEVRVTHSDLAIGGDVFNRGLIFLNRGRMTVTGTLHILPDGRLKSEEGTLRARYVSLEGGVWLDPTQAFLGGFSVGETGYVTAGAGDQVFVEDDFINQSRESSTWDTREATLTLSGAGRKVVALPGEDRGDSPAGRLDNFAWGVLEIASGVEVEFTDGNPENDGTALYVGVLDIKDRTLIDPENLRVLPFFGDATLYYNSTLPENDYLGGLTYVFADGAGTLTAQIPEPATIWLIVSVLPFLSLAIRKRPTKPTVS